MYTSGVKGQGVLELSALVLSSRCPVGRVGLDRPFLALFRGHRVDPGETKRRRDEMGGEGMRREEKG